MLPTLTQLPLLYIYFNATPLKCKNTGIHTLYNYWWPHTLPFGNSFLFLSVPLFSLTSVDLFLSSSFTFLLHFLAPLLHPQSVSVTHAH